MDYWFCVRNKICFCCLGGGVNIDGTGSTVAWRPAWILFCVPCEQAASFHPQLVSYQLIVMAPCILSRHGRFTLRSQVGTHEDLMNPYPSELPLKDK